MTVPEAALRLGISESGAYKLAKRGELPVIRLGRRVLVVTKDLDRLLGHPVEPSISFS